MTSKKGLYHLRLSPTDAYLDLSTDYDSLLIDGKPKNDLVRGNSNLYDEEIFQIYKNPVINHISILREKVKKVKKKYKNNNKRYIRRINRNFSNSENYYTKLMNPLFFNFIHLKENKVYCYMMNGKFCITFQTQEKDLDSQNSPNNEHINGAILPNDSQNNEHSS